MKVQSTISSFCGSRNGQLQPIKGGIELRRRVRISNDERNWYQVRKQKNIPFVFSSVINSRA